MSSTVDYTCQTHVGCLVVRSAMGKEGPPLQSELERLLKSNGPEWLVTRVKAIWNAALHLRNGDKQSAIGQYQAHSIAYHRCDGTPKGPWRPVVRGFAAAQRSSVIRRYAAVLRWYQCLVSPKSTTKQVVKNLKSIQTEREGLLTQSISDDDLISKGQSWTYDVPELRGLARRALEDGYVWHPPCESAVTAEPLHMMSYYYSGHSLNNRKCHKSDMNFYKVPGASFALSLITEPWLPEILDKRTPCYEMRQFLRSRIRGYDKHCVGKVSLIQEPGFKGRAVVSGTAWIQLAFMPAHKYIASLNRKLPTCCVEDQVKGAYAVLDFLKKSDRPIYCTDLSSATDRFPRYFSFGVMNAIGLVDYSYALEELCNKPFEGYALGVPNIYYGVGQPMGIYSSFPLFHLSNTVVAERAEQKAKAMGRNLDLFRNGKSYYVLGDDIVFSDNQVRMNYDIIMTNFGVKTSPEKCFEGDITEFAGFIATRTAKSACCFRPYKTPSGNVITNPLEFMYALGQKGLRRSAYWSEQFRLFEHTISQRSLDLSPLVRQQRWGNPSNRFRTSDIWSVINGLYQYHGNLPDLTGLNPRGSSIPLFQERGMFDWDHYNPATFAAEEAENRTDESRWRFVKRSLNRDPLIKEQKALRRAQTTQPNRQTVVEEKAEHPTIEEGGKTSTSDPSNDGRPTTIGGFILRYSPPSGFSEDIVLADEQASISGPEEEVGFH